MSKYNKNKTNKNKSSNANKTKSDMVKSKTVATAQNTAVAVNTKQNTNAALTTIKQTKQKSQKYYNKSFVDLCQTEQDYLKWCLPVTLAQYFIESNIITGDGYIYAKGNIPCLLTAHMDTVHTELPNHIFEWTARNEKGEIEHYIKADEGIGGDDRCGIYMILQILEHYKKQNKGDKGDKENGETGTNMYPSVLFCEDEETGCVGSGKFAKSEYTYDVAQNNKYLIELDRKGNNDAVFYSCGNEEFQDFVCDVTGYKLEYGSYTDICELSPICDLASVNLSCGYYKEHTPSEFVCFEEMEHTIEVTIKLIDKANEKDTPVFDYQEETWGYGYGGYYNDYGYYLNYYSKSRNNKNGGKNKNKEVWVFEYYDDYFEGRKEDVIEGGNFEDCLFNFLVAHTNVCIDDIWEYWEWKDLED